MTAAQHTDTTTAAAAAAEEWAPAVEIAGYTDEDIRAFYWAAVDAGEVEAAELAKAELETRVGGRTGAYLGFGA